MRRAFTIAVMLAAMVAAAAQAQTNQSTTGSKSLVELEAQAKAKKKKTTTTASNETNPQTPAADGSTTATGTTTPAAKKTTTARKPVAKKTTTTASARRTTTAAKPAAKKPAPADAAPAATADTNAAAAAPATGATAPVATAPATAAPATAPAAAAEPAAVPTPDKKIYKANELPDKWKFQQEKAPEKKPVTDGTGASMAPVPDPAAVAVAPAEADAAPAAPTAASAPTPATPASASPAPAAAAPAPVATQTPAGTQQKPQPAPTPTRPATPQPPPAKPADKPAPKPAPTSAAAKPAPKPAAKPGSHAWRDRGYISGNAGWQASSTTFSDSRSLATLTGDPEQRQMTSKYEVKAGPMFDIGAGIRLVKNLGVAVAVTRFSVSNDIAIDATVPHPFFFNTPRALTGTTPGTREELAIHLDAVYVIPGRKLQVAIFGGPTFFNARQTVASDFSYNDTFPYDNPPTFTSATSASESKSVTGFNVGADIGYYFTKVFGVGGVIRFSRGTLASSIGDLDLGGPQVSAGVRIRLRSGPSSPKKPAVPAPQKPAPKKK